MQVLLNVENFQYFSRQTRCIRVYYTYHIIVEYDNIYLYKHIKFIYTIDPLWILFLYLEKNIENYRSLNCIIIYTWEILIKNGTFTRWWDICTNVSLFFLTIKVKHICVALRRIYVCTNKIHCRFFSSRSIFKCDKALFNICMWYICICIFKRQFYLNRFFLRDRAWIWKSVIQKYMFCVF